MEQFARAYSEERPSPDIARGPTDVRFTSQSRHQKSDATEQSGTEFSMRDSFLIRLAALSDGMSHH
jgi:hypothetical protein